MYTSRADSAVSMPCSDGTHATSPVTRCNYDIDGNLLDTCPAQQFDFARESVTTSG